MEAKSQREIAQAVKRFEANKIIPAHHVEVVDHHSDAGHQTKPIA